MQHNIIVKTAVDKRRETIARKKAAATTAVAQLRSAVAAASLRKAEGLRKRKETLALKKSAIFDKQIDTDDDYDPDALVRRIWRLLSSTNGLMYRLLVNRRGRLIGEFPAENIDKEIKYVKKYEDFRPIFIISDDKIFESGDRLVIIKSTPVEAKRLFQHFADGISHCVFTPLYKKLETLIGDAVSKDNIKKYTCYIKQLKELEVKWSKGVPEDCMEQVAKTAHIKIPFCDVIGGSPIVYNPFGRVATVSLQNTRFNHVETGNIVRTDEPLLLSQEALNNMWRFNHNNNIFYDIPGKIINGNITQLKTLQYLYKLRDLDNMILDEFSKSIKLQNYKFNSHKYKNAYEFAKAGCVVHSQPVQLNKGVATGHIDMPKAYTQFRKAPTYNGFLGVIHQWSAGSYSLDFIKEHIGIYKIRIVQCDNELLLRLGLVNDSIHILPSVEISYFASLGVKLDVTEGLYGSKMEFDFTPAMLQKNKDGIPRYSKWAGLTAMEINSKRHNIKGSYEYAQRLKCDYPNTYYWDESDLKDIVTIDVPVLGSYSTRHILAFITAYNRINMIEEMRKFAVENILTVVLDGIYFKDTKPGACDWFVDKDVVEQKYWGNPWYQNLEILPTLDTGTIYSRNTVLTGQGGCGKTYGVMTATNLHSPVYVVPCHTLGSDGNNKYDCQYITIHRLIGLECQPYCETHPPPPVILLDEITQYSRENVERVFELYPSSLIILAGDIDDKGQWFQCRSGTPGNFVEIWKPTNVDVKHIEGDRRSQDDQLKQLKLQIRSKMVEVFHAGEDAGNTDESAQIKRWARQNLPCVTIWDAIQKFKNGEDIWLAATHKTNDTLLKAGIISGYYKKGGSISKIPLPDYTKRGAYTIHSFQGKTISEGAIFISIADLFEYAMLYTAVSRATHIEQLVFID